MLFGFQLKRMIGRVAYVLALEKRSELGEWT